jgi:hypothetical protein
MQQGQARIPAARSVCARGADDWQLVLQEIVADRQTVRLTTADHIRLPLTTQVHSPSILVLYGGLSDKRTSSSKVDQ